MGNEGEREREKKGRESGAEGKEWKRQRKRKKVDRGGRSEEKKEGSKERWFDHVGCAVACIRIACVILRACMSGLKHCWQAFSWAAR